MKGQLSQTHITDILQMLSFGDREGILYVKKGGNLLSLQEEARIYIKNGKVCFVSLEGASTLVEVIKQKFGEDLSVEKEEDVLKVAEFEEVKDIAKDIIRDRIMVIMTWEDGIYEFSDVDVDIPPIYPINSLLLSVVSSLEEGEGITDIPPFSIPIVEPRNKVEGTLSPEEWKVLCWLDSKRNVLEIAGLSSLPYNRCVMAIKRLLERGIIKVIQPANVPDGSLLKGNILSLYRKGEFLEVISKIDHIIALMPEDKDLYLIKAESLYNLEMYDEAVKVLTNLANKYKDPEIMRFLGYALAGSGKFKEAVRVLEDVGETVLSEILKIFMDTLRNRKQVI